MRQVGAPERNPSGPHGGQVVVSALRKRKPALVVEQLSLSRLHHGQPGVRAHPEIAHSTELRGGTCYRSAKAPGGEDLQVEEPVSGWDCASFHFHATVAGMLGPTLIRDEVVQVGEPGEKRLLASTGMMESLHCEQFALDSIMGLIQQGARR